VRPVLEHGGAFDSNIELMRAEGIRIVSINRESELEQIAGLGQFDIVLGADVIEHVPHIPGASSRRSTAGSDPAASSYSTRRTSLVTGTGERLKGARRSSS
jgi:hypothetical protein